MTDAELDALCAELQEWARQQHPGSYDFSRLIGALLAIKHLRAELDAADPSRWRKRQQQRKGA